jgi:nucleolar protein 56
MKAYVAANIVGVFAFDEKGKVITKRLFPKEAEAIAERLDASRGGALIEEERVVLDELKGKGYADIIMDKGAKLDGVRITVDPDNKGKKIASEDFRKLASEAGWIVTPAQINILMSRVNVILSGRKIKAVSKDKVIMQVIGVIDELEIDLNSLYERLREWYGLHFPELSKEMKSHEKFAEIVQKYGTRENIMEEQLASIASKSVGMSFNEEDAHVASVFAKSVLEMTMAKEKLSKYLENVCAETMPNLSAVAGPLLASRLIAQAGGLEKIAKLPSSTIQLLGAEKALFRHLKGQGKAPKYGVLFGHPLIQQAPKHMKGKVARLISAKLSLAAKMDFYSKRDDSKQMRENLERKVAGLIKGSSGDADQ